MTTEDTGPAQENQSPTYTLPLPHTHFFLFPSLPNGVCEFTVKANMSNSIKNEML